MDNQDKIIKNILSAFDDESVPLGFDSKIFDKIKYESSIRESRRETLHNYIMLIIIATVFTGALLILNHYFFRINLNFNLNIDISAFSRWIQDASALLVSGESLIWVGIGTNIALLLLCERIISEKIRKKEAEKS